MRATGLGPMPGSDFKQSLRWIASELSLPFMPELAERGVHAAMTGRAMAVLEGLTADIDVDRWRLSSGLSLDQRRARSTLAHDLDVLEEELDGYEGPFKIHIPGPLTLAAHVELPRGGHILRDTGACIELAESLSEGIDVLVSELFRRLPGIGLHVQVDEPELPAVLLGGVRTVSGFGKHMPMETWQADALLRTVAQVIQAGGAVPVLSCHSTGIPVEMVTNTGFKAVAFDLGATKPTDEWAQLLDAGMQIWPHVSDRVFSSRSVNMARNQLGSFVSAAGFSLEDVHSQVVLAQTSISETISSSDVVRFLAFCESVAASYCG